MNYFIFDTETTGLQDKDEVVQFSGLLLDSNCRLIRLYNFYCYPLVEFDPKASAVNGLDKKKVMQLSGGKFFEEQFSQMHNVLDCKDLIWIGYNISYDIRMVKQTLKNAGYPEHAFGRETQTLGVTGGIWNFDVMKSAAVLYNKGKYMKLMHAFERVCPKGINNVKEEYTKLLNYAGITEHSEFHNALFDAYVTYTIFKEVYRLCR